MRKHKACKQGHRRFVAASPAQGTVPRAELRSAAPCMIEQARSRHQRCPGYTLGRKRWLTHCDAHTQSLQARAEKWCGCKSCIRYPIQSRASKCGTTMIERARSRHRNCPCYTFGRKRWLTHCDAQTQGLQARAKKLCGYKPRTRYPIQSTVLNCGTVHD